MVSPEQTEKIQENFGKIHIQVLQPVQMGKHLFLSRKIMLN